MKTNSSLILLFVALVAAIPAPQATAQPRETKLDRTVLPLAEPDHPRSTILDARDATLARQIALGVVPAGTKLAAKPPENEPSPEQAPGYRGKGLRPDDSGRHPSSQQAARN